MSTKMKGDRIETLAHKYKNGTVSPEEQAEFDSWYAAKNDEEFFHSDAADPEALRARLYAPLAQAMMQRSKPDGRLPLFRRYGVAASVALMLIAGGLYYFSHIPASVPAIVYANDIAPGKQGATLTLANGRKISLGTAGKGQIASESGIKISKTAQGQIVYELSDQGAAAGLTNTLSTARGETYALRLADGTQVWLNADSKLTYTPARGLHNNREVRLEGEAYFEVAKDKLHPFIVQSAQQKIEVLGTHFNVNAYAREPDIKTTLIEGSVKVSNGQQEAVLKPGQRALCSALSLNVQPADVDAELDWKNNSFVFREERISAIMKKLSRWYDVYVVYQNGEVNRATFSGQISRSANISEILKSLQSTGKVAFSLNGKTVTVSD